jgi:plastocyanin
MKNASFTTRVAAALLVLGGFILSGILTAQPQNVPAAGSQVTIDNFSFSPATVTVPVGSTLRWTNHDDVPHTVVSDEKVFRSKPLDTDEAFTYTFTKAGTYSYFCSLHPKMVAKVVVQ